VLVNNCNKMCVTRVVLGVTVLAGLGPTDCSKVMYREGQLEYTNATSAAADDACQCKAGFLVVRPGRRLQEVNVYCTRK
jgi:hypothetical protein